MPGTIEKKLTDLGIVLPKPVAPVANYVPFVRTGNFMVVSGQLCAMPSPHHTWPASDPASAVAGAVGRLNPRRRPSSRAAPRLRGR